MDGRALKAVSCNVNIYLCFFQEMEYRLERARRRRIHGRADSFIMVIVSHGDETGIDAEDNKLVKLEYITAWFRDRKCRRLRGKPKLFFIETCRESEYKNNFNCESQIQFDAMVCILPK